MQSVKYFVLLALATFAMGAAVSFDSDESQGCALETDETSDPSARDLVKLAFCN
ncbi:hypothetical protein QCA50_008556 [Cerrena zonata]|uniref:Uncharacterized protein n=1 Tax=Cerrena zonata TaxID=2478898 RepID=A0AAW0FB38_9APHY